MRSLILRFAYHLVGGWCYGTSAALITRSSSCYRPHLQGLMRSTSNDEACNNTIDDMISSISSLHRRAMFMSSIVAPLGVILATDVNDKAYADGNLSSILGQLKEASAMLNGIPDLIKAENWDGVRAVLIKSPLSELWASGGSKQLLKQYADAIGNELPDGDEMAALELREDAISHLRYLDMAVYNNIFNPIATEGESGATRELIRSYYEDPINEWKASKAALDALIGLATVTP